MRRRENEYRSQGDEMSATVLAHELKVILHHLSRDIENLINHFTKSIESFTQLLNLNMF